MQRHALKRLLGLIPTIISFSLSLILGKLDVITDLTGSDVSPLAFAFAITLTPIIAAIIGYLLFRFIAKFYKIQKIALTSHIALPWKIGVIFTWMLGTVGFVGIWGGWLDPTLFNLSVGNDYLKFIYVLLVGFILAYLVGSIFYWFLSKILFIVPIPKIPPSPTYKFLIYWGVSKALVPFGVRRRA